MLHEHLQTDIVRENGLPRIRTRGPAVHRCRHMRRRGVEFEQKESRLTSALVADNIARNGESIHQKILRQVIK